jgi:hypothetical protein
MLDLSVLVLGGEKQKHSQLAGVEGIEPPVAVLETAGLPLTDTPNYLRTRGDCCDLPANRYAQALQGG